MDHVPHSSVPKVPIKASAGDDASAKPTGANPRKRPLSGHATSPRRSIKHAAASTTADVAAAPKVPRIEAGQRAAANSTGSTSFSTSGSSGSSSSASANANAQAHSTMKLAVVSSSPDSLDAQQDPRVLNGSGVEKSVHGPTAVGPEHRSDLVPKAPENLDGVHSDDDGNSFAGVIASNAAKERAGTAIAEAAGNVSAALTGSVGKKLDRPSDAPSDGAAKRAEVKLGQHNEAGDGKEVENNNSFNSENSEDGVNDGDTSEDGVDDDDDDSDDDNGDGDGDCDGDEHSSQSNDQRESTIKRAYAEDRSATRKQRKDNEPRTKRQPTAATRNVMHVGESGALSAWAKVELPFNRGPHAGKLAFKVNKVGNLTSPATGLHAAPLVVSDFSPSKLWLGNRPRKRLSAAEQCSGDIDDDDDDDDVDVDVDDDDDDEDDGDGDGGGDDHVLENVSNNPGTQDSTNPSAAVRAACPVQSSEANTTADCSTNIGLEKEHSRKSSASTRRRSPARRPPASAQAAHKRTRIMPEGAGSKRRHARGAANSGSPLSISPHDFLAELRLPPMKQLANAKLVFFDNVAQMWRINARARIAPQPHDDNDQHQTPPTRTLREGSRHVPGNSMIHLGNFMSKKDALVMLAGFKFFQRRSPRASGAIAPRSSAAAMLEASSVGAETGHPAASATPASLNQGILNVATAVSALAATSDDKVGAFGQQQVVIHKSTSAKAGETVHVTDQRQTNATATSASQRSVTSLLDGPGQLRLPEDTFVKFSWGNGVGYVGRLVESSLNAGLDASQSPPSYYHEDKLRRAHSSFGLHRSWFRTIEFAPEVLVNVLMRPHDQHFTWESTQWPHPPSAFHIRAFRSWPASLRNLLLNSCRCDSHKLRRACTCGAVCLEATRVKAELLQQECDQLQQAVHGSPAVRRSMRGSRNGTSRGGAHLSDFDILSAIVTTLEAASEKHGDHLRLEVLDLSGLFVQTAEPSGESDKRSAGDAGKEVSGAMTPPNHTDREGDQSAQHSTTTDSGKGEADQDQATVNGAEESPSLAATRPRRRAAAVAMHLPSKHGLTWLERLGTVLRRTHVWHLNMRNLDSAPANIRAASPEAWVQYALLLISGHVTELLVPDEEAVSIARALYGVASCYKEAQVDTLLTNGELSPRAPQWSNAVARQCTDAMAAAVADDTPVSALTEKVANFIKEPFKANHFSMHFFARQETVICSERTAAAEAKAKTIARQAGLGRSPKKVDQPLEKTAPNVALVSAQTQVAPTRLSESSAVLSTPTSTHASAADNAAIAAVTAAVQSASGHANSCAVASEGALPGSTSALSVTALHQQVIGARSRVQQLINKRKRMLRDGTFKAQVVKQSDLASTALADVDSEDSDTEPTTTKGTSSASSVTTAAGSTASRTGTYPEDANGLSDKADSSQDCATGPDVDTVPRNNSDGRLAQELIKVAAKRNRLLNLSHCMRSHLPAILGTMEAGINPNSETLCIENINQSNPTSVKQLESHFNLLHLLLRKDTSVKRVLFSHYIRGADKARRSRGKSKASTSRRGQRVEGVPDVEWVKDRIGRLFIMTPTQRCAARKALRALYDKLESMGALPQCPLISDRSDRAGLVTKSGRQKPGHNDEDGSDDDEDSRSACPQCRALDADAALFEECGASSSQKRLVEQFADDHVHNFFGAQNSILEDTKALALLCLGRGCRKIGILPPIPSHCPGSINDFVKGGARNGQHQSRRNRNGKLGKTRKHVPMDHVHIGVVQQNDAVKTNKSHRKKPGATASSASAEPKEPDRFLVKFRWPFTSKKPNAGLKKSSHNFATAWRRLPERFSSPEQAARAYDRIVRALFGNIPQTNFGSLVYRRGRRATSLSTSTVARAANAHAPWVLAKERQCRNKQARSQADKDDYDKADTEQHGTQREGAVSSRFSAAAGALLAALGHKRLQNFKLDEGPCHAMQWRNSSPGHDKVASGSDSCGCLQLAGWHVHVGYGLSSEQVHARCAAFATCIQNLVNSVIVEPTAGAIPIVASPATSDVTPAGSGSIPVDRSPTQRENVPRVQSATGTDAQHAAILRLQNGGDQDGARALESAGTRFQILLDHHDQIWTHLEQLADVPAMACAAQVSLERTRVTFLAAAALGLLNARFLSRSGIRKWIKNLNQNMFVACFRGFVLHTHICELGGAAAGLQPHRASKPDAGLVWCPSAALYARMPAGTPDQEETIRKFLFGNNYNKVQVRPKPTLSRTGWPALSSHRPGIMAHRRSSIIPSTPVGGLSSPGWRQSAQVVGTRGKRKLLPGIGNTFEKSNRGDKHKRGRFYGGATAPAAAGRPQMLSLPAPLPFFDPLLVAFTHKVAVVGKDGPTGEWVPCTILQTYEKALTQGTPTDTAAKKRAEAMEVAAQLSAASRNAASGTTDGGCKRMDTPAKSGDGGDDKQEPMIVEDIVLVNGQRVCGVPAIYVRPACCFVEIPPFVGVVPREVGAADTLKRIPVTSVAPKVEPSQDAKKSTSGQIAHSNVCASPRKRGTGTTSASAGLSNGDGSPRRGIPRGRAARRAGARKSFYKCRHCGQPKKGHVCTMSTPQHRSLSPPQGFTHHMPQQKLPTNSTTTQTLGAASPSERAGESRGATTGHKSSQAVSSQTATSASDGQPAAHASSMANSSVRSSQSAYGPGAAEGH